MTHVLAIDQGTTSTRAYSGRSRPGAATWRSIARGTSAAATRRGVIVMNSPLGNMTSMSEPERRLLGAWIAQGAKGPAATNIKPL